MEGWLAEGIAASDVPLFQQQKIWSAFSDDKPDIAIKSVEALATLLRGRGADKPLKILSIGCGVEPQLMLFYAHGSGGVHLLDCDDAALAVLQERKEHQNLKRIKLLKQDYTRFTDEKVAVDFSQLHLDGGVDAVFIHHSLYYLEAERWMPLLRNIYHHMLLPGGTIHCVMMSSREKRPTSTTWLYNHFAGKFCGHTNNQDLQAFGELWAANYLTESKVRQEQSVINFLCPDFRDFMSVIWMIMLYPMVHDFSLEQRQEITAHMYENFFSVKQPLQQVQDHLFIRKTGSVK